jgi:hypothetical protein
VVSPWKRAIGAGLVALSSLSSCCGPSPSVASVEAADRLYSLLEKRDYDAVADTCSKEYLTAFPHEILVARWKEQGRAFGKLKERRRITSSVRSNRDDNSSGTGTRTFLVFACKYEYVSSTEELIVDEVAGSKPVEISGYHVTNVRSNAR